ncbi:hypothetical protein C2800_03995 [Pasteurella multocida]|uniref:Uncharacterized protein n=1 Tax=Pasteurella multocida TaxID=747 RepID=A0A849CGM1_PASMD|nr:hypothetical protein [Pasteurella multocida]MCH1906349.1 hypothetical protein [Pasteurella multocida]MCL7773144.1 hypothetical protein [Pasteurella multocida]MCL7794211.1 hypothetical protein [Pasteurella multocida]MCL7836267.1 hypothetical protein [Pasteurella multocida]MCO5922302.1 hypothetical protein [Pasteurella multocida]
MSKLPLFILQVARRIPVEKVINRNTIGRHESKKSTKPKPSIKKAELDCRHLCGKLTPMEFIKVFCKKEGKNNG